MISGYGNNPDRWRKSQGWGGGAQLATAEGLLTDAARSGDDGHG
jgi:hypothetical protein